MLAPRPEVKRTYTRLKPQEQEPIDCKRNEKQNMESFEVLSVNNFNSENEIQNNYTRLVFDSEIEFKSSLEIVKPDKMRKITDFFKKSSIEYDYDENIRNKSLSKEGKKENLINFAASTKKPFDSKRQTFLDLGQKNLISNQCPECLMHFNKSFMEDVTMHKKFHAQYLKGFNFVHFESDWMKEIAPPGDKMITWSKFKFYEIIRFDKDRRIFKRLSFFLDFVHVQLGAETLTNEEMHIVDRYGAILVTDFSTRIVGLGLFERCKNVFKSRIGSDSSAIELESSAIGAMEMSENFIGVSRIWVDAKNRSRGLASIILDLKCKGNRKTIAFSQPTPTGFVFAKAYQDKKRLQCNIYLS